jgi:DNA-binding MarR family transcriptional regulator
MFDLRNHLPYLLNRVGVALIEDFSRQLAADDLTVPMWRVLAALWHDGPRHMGNLAELTSIEISTLSRLVGTLQRRGIVTRKRGGRDGRYVRVALTPRGKSLTESLIPKALAIEARLIGSLSSREVATLRRLLDALHENLRTADRAEESA